MAQASAAEAGVTLEIRIEVDRDQHGTVAHDPGGLTGWGVQGPGRAVSSVTVAAGGGGGVGAEAGAEVVIDP